MIFTGIEEAKAFWCGTVDYLFLGCGLCLSQCKICISVAEKKLCPLTCLNHNLWDLEVRGNASNSNQGSFE